MFLLLRGYDSLDGEAGFPRRPVRLSFAAGISRDPKAIAAAEIRHRQR